LDVARAAHVGVATVDRVINLRGGVTVKTSKKVIAAAQQLGLHRILPSLYHSGVRLDVILTQKEKPFMKRLNNAFIRTAMTLDRSVIIERTFYDGWSNSRLAARVRETHGDGLIMYGQESPELTDAMAAVSARGIPVVVIVSDLPSAIGHTYVGIDNKSAGRTAAFFLSKMSHRSGDVVVLCNSLRYHGHVDRVEGFREGLIAYGADLRLLEVLEGNDDLALSRQLLRASVRRSKNVAGIYNAGAANRAVERVLIEERLAGNVIFVGHELTDVTVKLLRDGTMTMTMDQNPEMEARYAIEALLRDLIGSSGSSPSPDDTIGHRPTGIVPFTLYTADTIPVGFSEDRP